MKVYIQNDAVAALASGTMGKLHGCVLVAGTGCIAYGVSKDGKEARAAGAGPILGDWGRYLILIFICLFYFILKTSFVLNEISIPVMVLLCTVDKLILFMPLVCLVE